MVYGLKAPSCDPLNSNGFAEEFIWPYVQCHRPTLLQHTVPLAFSRLHRRQNKSMLYKRLLGCFTVYSKIEKLLEKSLNGWKQIVAKWK